MEPMNENEDESEDIYSTPGSLIYFRDEEGRIFFDPDSPLFRELNPDDPLVINGWTVEDNYATAQLGSYRITVYPGTRQDFEQSRNQVFFPERDYVEPYPGETPDSPGFIIHAVNADRHGYIQFSVPLGRPDADTPEKLDLTMFLIQRHPTRILENRSDLQEPMITKDQPDIPGFTWINAGDHYYAEWHNVSEPGYPGVWLRQISRDDYFRKIEAMPPECRRESIPIPPDCQSNPNDEMTVMEMTDNDELFALIPGPTPDLDRHPLENLRAMAEQERPINYYNQLMEKRKPPTIEYELDLY